MTCSEDRAKVALLAVLALGTLFFALFLNEPGHISIDESVYHLMARGLSDSGSLALLNGYEEFASPEFVFQVSQPHDGLLYPQYPYFYPVLAAPFYLAFGYKGLFFLSTAAFLGTVGLCYAIGQKLFRDRSLSLNACLILVLASYAWEYSQASWPHAVSMLFVAGAVYLAISACHAAGAGRCLTLALAAGLVVGFGTGVRLDVLFAVPALVLPFLFSTPPRFLPVAAMALGSLPGLVLLGATNYAKFGIASPLTYGAKPDGAATSLATYLPLLALGLLVLLLLWALTRPRARALAAARPWGSAAVLALAASLLLLVPEVWALASRFAHGAYQLVVDLRVRDLGILEGGLSRGPGGGMIYMGAYKKSLLQSCPYLIALLVPLFYLVGRGKDVPALSFLFLVPAAYVAVFSYRAWHGGLSLNLRYFLPLLPFTSLLAAYVWRELVRESGTARWGPRMGAIAGALLMMGVVGLLASNRLADEGIEAVLLTLPLVLSVALLAVLSARRLAPERRRAALANGAAAIMVVAFAWAGTIAFTYDYPRAWAKRSVMHDYSREVARHVTPDSIVITQYVTALSGLYELDRVRLAQATKDEFQGFRALLDFHLEAGRPVYGWFEPALWEEIEKAGRLAGLRAEPIHEYGWGRLARIVPATRSAAEQERRTGPPEPPLRVPTE